MLVEGDKKLNIVDENCIKALNIYKNIMTLNANIAKICDDSIIPQNKDKDNNDLINICKSDMKLLKSKRNIIKKLGEETIEYIEVIEEIIININAKEKIELYNIYKLNCLYYLYKYITSEKNLEDIIINIEDEIIECINDKKSYYNILSLLKNIEPENDVNKKIKIKNYFSIIKYLNPFLFNNRISSFMSYKSIFYEQYKIYIPNIENRTMEDYTSLKNNLNYIETALNILKESENFIFHERFNYFRKYKNKNKTYLEIINKILLIKKKLPLKSLENYSMELAEEEIEFLQNSLIKKDSKFMNMLNESIEKEQELNAIISENNELKKEINQLKNRANELSDKLNYIDNEYQKKINEIKSFREEVQNIIVSNKLINDQIKQIEKDIKEEKDKNSGIQCRDINSKI